MKTMKRVIAGIAAAALSLLSGPRAFAQTTQPSERQYDVVVYGGTSGGVTAAVEAAKGGKRVVIIEPTGRLGGMSSGGLGWTDVGNPEIVGGLSHEFYHRIFKLYQSPSRWKHVTREKFAGGSGQYTKSIDQGRQLQWLFEPHVAAEAFANMAREAKVDIVLRERLDLGPAGVTRDRARITSLTTESGQTYRGKVFIDASYEGDLMARAGVKFTIGREGNDVYGETINGIQAAKAVKNQLPKGIDPYIVKGDASSGLLTGVNASAGGPDGAGDQRIQAYCYRMCLTEVPENRVMIEKPADYDEKQYELLFRAIEAGQKDRFFKFDAMPNRKTDSNNDSGISTDFIGMNYDYPESDYAAREKAARAHENWQRGLIWTLQNHPRVTEEIRNRHAKWGLAKDEFIDTNHWPHQMYVREARRMVGQSVATERTLLDDSNTTQSIGMGAYAMDSHNTQRYVDANGHVRNEGDVQIKLSKPYKLDYGTIIPKGEECENLLVPVCISASHIAYGSIRMEPVFMILGQSAGAAASVAIDGNTSVQNIAYDQLKKRLIDHGQVLSWAPAAKP